MFLKNETKEQKNKKENITLSKIKMLTIKSKC